VLGHRQPGKPHAQADARWLVHLPEHHRRLVDHAALDHLVVELRAFAGALPYPGENREATVLCGNGADQLHDDDRLARPGPAEDTGLAAFTERRDQVDNFDAGLKHLDGRRLLLKRRRTAVNRLARSVHRRGLAIHRLPQHVEDAPQHSLANRHLNWQPCRIGDLAARQAVRRVHGHRPHLVTAKVLLHLQHQILGAIARHPNRVVDIGQTLRWERHIHHRAQHLRHYTPDFAHQALLLSNTGRIPSAKNHANEPPWPFSNTLPSCPAPQLPPGRGEPPHRRQYPESHW